MPILSQQTTYLWINTTLYTLYKWNITVCMLGYVQIHDITSRNATIYQHCNFLDHLYLLSYLTF